MRIPASLKKNPIIDVTMEFRFNSNLEYELIPGAFWAKIPDEIKNKFRFERLPIADMPIQIRKMTPNWKIIPYFQFVSQDLLISIGIGILSFSNKGEYNDWESFWDKIKIFFNAFHQTGIVSSFLRVSLRYVNYIGCDIFKNGTHSISCNNKLVTSDSESIRYKVREDNNNIVMVSLINDATITSSFNERFIGKTGSIIDIDSSREGNFSKDELLNILQSLNNSSKKKFFESITDELLESFEPEWEKK